MSHSALSVTTTAFHAPHEGPGRHADPVEAMRRDAEELLAETGAIEAHRLIGRGWTTGQIVEHLPDAHRLLTGAAGAEAA